MAKNQTSFRKGRSGNPKGAPKRDWSWSGEFQRAVEVSTKQGRSVKEIVAESLVREALKGNIQAIRELTNRMDGAPKQNMNIDGALDHIIITRGE
jgi:hypothetical protein